MWKSLTQGVRNATDRLLANQNLRGFPVVRLDRPGPSVMERTVQACWSSRRRWPSTLGLLLGEVPSLADGALILVRHPSMDDLVTLAETLERHSAEALVSIDPNLLDQPDFMREQDLAQLVARGIVVALELTATDQAASVQSALKVGLERLHGALGYTPWLVSIAGTSSRMIEDAVRSAGVAHMVTDQLGLADPHRTAWPSLTIGRDVHVEGLRRLLDATPRDAATTLARVRVRQVRDRLGSGQDRP